MAAPSLKELTQTAIQANKNHQSALKAHIERLEADLRHVDKLLVATSFPLFLAHPNTHNPAQDCVDAAEEEGEPELDVGGYILVPGALRATAPVSSRDLVSQESPFYEDAAKRARYLSFTSIHPMKRRELDALADAVRTENYRLHAFEAQKKGLDPFSRLDQLSQAEIEANKEGLDWERIAERVSTVSNVPRAARECEIRWLGDQHPNINHEAWSQAELANLKTLITAYDDERVDWVEVAQKLGSNRTPIDCMRHAFRRKLHVWNQDANTRLLEAIKLFGTNNWALVARYVSEDATAQQCQSRWFRTLDPNLKRGPWSAEEDARLQVAVAAYEHSWVEVAALIPGRNNEQCRDHWMDKLSPKIVKGKWTEEEDRILLEAVAELGPRWRDVSQRLDRGRTDNMCRSRYEVLRKRATPETIDPPNEPAIRSSSVDAS